MPSRLITPSQLSLFSISPVIGAWWEELQAQKLFEGSKPAVSELDQQLFADGLRHEQVLLSKLEKAGHSIARLSGRQTDADYAATREAMAEGVEFIHQASLCNEEMRGSADLLRPIDRQWTTKACVARIDSGAGRTARIHVKHDWRGRRHDGEHPREMKRVTRSIRSRLTKEGLTKPALPDLRVLRLITSGAAVLMLTGCGAKLPDCDAGLKGNTGKQAPALTKKTPQTGKQVLIGIDGSGSMLGYAQASNKNVWLRLLQSIRQGILLEGLHPITYRIGAGTAEGPLKGSVTQATNPCFFKGCDGYRPVASSLETLWTIQSKGKALPLRLLVSDLEVNQSDISSLLAGIQPDLAKGASAGILGIKAPFSGDVFGANGQVIQSGNVNRPLFILATGPKEQVKSLLDEVKRTLSLMGITNTKISIIDPRNSEGTKFAKQIAGVPVKEASPDANIRLGGQTYSSAQNADYQFIKLNPDATGLSVATTKTWSQGALRPDFGIADLEKLSIADGQPQAAEGMQVSSIHISGSNVRVEINVDQSAASGLYRVVIPAGSMPEEWWLSWDRAVEDKTNVGSKTQGLLLLMTTLNRQIAGEANAPPAAALCIALRN